MRTNLLNVLFTMHGLRPIRIMDFLTCKVNILGLIYCNDANKISRAYCVELFVLSGHENIFYTVDLAAINITLSQWRF